MASKRTMLSERALDSFAMSNLRSADTAVDGAVIWVSAGEFASADAKGGPRIGIVVGHLRPQRRRRSRASRPHAHVHPERVLRSGSRAGSLLLAPRLRCAGRWKITPANIGRGPRGAARHPGPTQCEHHV
jgi:hypothetical protein